MAIGKSGKYYANPGVMKGMQDSPEGNSLVQKDKPEHQGMQEDESADKRKVEVSKREDGGYHSRTMDNEGKTEEMDHDDLADVHNHLSRVYGEPEEHESDNDETQRPDQDAAMELPGVGKMIRGDY